MTHPPATYRHQWLTGGQFSHTRNTMLNTLVKPENRPSLAWRGHVVTAVDFDQFSV